jgi:methylamine methyltransferase corrinoid activation protein
LGRRTCIKKATESYHQKRDARIINSHEIGLELANNKEVSVLIPPAIKTRNLELMQFAMMLKSGFLNTDLAMVADYGTNAEIALKVKDDILSGSVAAGPAIEGQSIEKGMLASPGAISDLELIDKTKCRKYYIR